MTHEDDFIAELRMFYDNDETVINEVSEKRIRYLLNEYKKTVNTPKVTSIPTIITSYQPQKYRMREMEGTLHDNLLRLAKDISNKYHITYDEFVKSSGKGKGIVREARTEFCHTALSQLPINQQVLKAFLNVNHSTVVFYLKGKKYIKKNKSHKTLA